MSTATYPVTTFGAIMNIPTKPTLRADLQEVVNDILALRKLKTTEHFTTSRTQRELLSKLNASDLVAVARALEEAERKQQPIYQRSK